LQEENIAKVVDATSSEGFLVQDVYSVPRAALLRWCS